MLYFEVFSDGIRYTYNQFILALSEYEIRRQIQSRENDRKPFLVDDFLFENVLEKIDWAVTCTRKKLHSESKNAKNNFRNFSRQACPAMPRSYDLKIL